MAENSSPSPQISQNPSLSSPQIPLSPQLPPLHPQNPNPNPAANSNPASNQMMVSSAPNPNQMMASSAPNPNQMMASSAPNPTAAAFSSLQRAGSVARLTPLQQQQLAAARQFGAAGGAQMSFGAGGGAGGVQIGGGQQGMATRIGQAGGQIQMLPGQSIQQYNNMQAHLFIQQPRKAGVVQGMQFNSGNSSGQGLQGMQAVGMMGSLGMNPQIRGNGQFTYAQQQRLLLQQRQQMLQNSLTSPQKLSSQNLQRGQSLSVGNPQFSGLAQNGQSAQNALSQQPWLKHMQQAMSGPVSPSHNLQQQRQQQQPFSPQQASASQLQQQKSIGLTQQQLSLLVQQQAQLGSPRQQTQQQQLLQQHQQQMQLQFLQQQLQQQSPRMQGSGFQKSVSLTGSQPGTPASVTTITGGNSSQGAEAGNQVLGKRKIQDLVSQVDPLGKLDPAVEEVLLEIADNFIDTVTTFACSLAKHRKSSTLESKDLLLHLEKNLHLTIPGFTKEGQKYLNEPFPKDVHSRRLEVVKASVESQPFERDTNGSVRGGMSRQAVTDSSLNHPLKPSPSSEQLLLSATASRMHHEAPQF